MATGRDYDRSAVYVLRAEQEGAEAVLRGMEPPARSLLATTLEKAASRVFRDHCGEGELLLAMDDSAEAASREQRLEAVALVPRMAQNASRTPTHRGDWSPYIRRAARALAHCAEADCKHEQSAAALAITALLANIDALSAHRRLQLLLQSAAVAYPLAAEQLCNHFAARGDAELRAALTHPHCRNVIAYALDYAPAETCCRQCLAASVADLAVEAIDKAVEDPARPPSQSAMKALWLPLLMLRRFTGDWQRVLDRIVLGHDSGALLRPGGGVQALALLRECLEDPVSTRAGGDCLRKFKALQATFALRLCLSLKSPSSQLLQALTWAQPLPAGSGSAETEENLQRQQLAFAIRRSAQDEWGLALPPLQWRVDEPPLGVPQLVSAEEACRVAEDPLLLAQLRAESVIDGRAVQPSGYHLLCQRIQQHKRPPADRARCAPSRAWLPRALREAVRATHYCGWAAQDLPPPPWCWWTTSVAAAQLTHFDWWETPPPQWALAEEDTDTRALS